MEQYLVEQECGRSKLTEEDKPTPSGRTRDEFRRKRELLVERKRQQMQQEEPEEPEETNIEPPQKNNRPDKTKSVIGEMMSKKEFWIFISGLAFGYIIGRLI